MKRKGLRFMPVMDVPPRGKAHMLKVCNLIVMKILGLSCFNKIYWAYDIHNSIIWRYRREGI